MSPIVVDYGLMRSLATTPKICTAAMLSYREFFILPADSESMISDDE